MKAADLYPGKKPNNKISRLALISCLLSLGAKEGDFVTTGLRVRNICHLIYGLVFCAFYLNYIARYNVIEKSYRI